MGFIYFASDNYYSGSTVNMVPGRSEDAAMRLKALLKSAGWLLMGSSDFFITSSISTTFGVSASVDVLTNVTSTFAGGLNSAQISGSMCNHGSWFVLQAPTSQAFCFQVDTVQNNGNKNGNNSISWRIKYSSHGFQMTSASLTQTPRSLVIGDELILVGGGTDTAPTFGTYWVNLGLDRMHMVAESGSNYGFCMHTFKVSTAVAGFFSDNVFLFDSLTNQASGDPDPHVLYYRTNESDGWYRIVDNAAGFTNYTLVGSGAFNVNKQYARACAMRYSTTETNDTSTLPGNLGMNPHTGLDDTLPVVWAVDNLKAHAGGGTGGYKGISTFLRWSGSPRAVGDVITVTGSSGEVENRLVASVNNPGGGAVDYLTLPFSGTIVNF